MYEVIRVEQYFPPLCLGKANTMEQARALVDVDIAVLLEDEEVNIEVVTSQCEWEIREV